MVEQGEQHEIVSEVKEIAVPPLVEEHYPQFPDGAWVDHRGDSAYIYNESGDKRWFIQDFVMEWENKRHMTLTLSGRTRGGSWHMLAGAYQAMNAETQEVVESGVNLDVLQGEVVGGLSYPVTPSRNLLYSDSRGGMKYEGWQTGKYGEKEDIESDIREYNALATTPEEAPEQIDVHATIQRLAETFQQGSFDVPEFVIPELEQVSLPEERTLPQRALTSARIVFQRLRA